MPVSTDPPAHSSTIEPGTSHPEFFVISVPRPSGSDDAASQVCISLERRAGRLPLLRAVVRPGSISIICADGRRETLGSTQRPIEAELINAARRGQLLLAEFDADNGALLASVTIETSATKD